MHAVWEVGELKYANHTEAIFVKRPNRFIAVVLINGIEETVHVKNTGRCQELLMEGVKVILVESDNPNRKTRYDLVAVYRDGYGWINIDSMAPNQVVAEWLDSEDSMWEKDAYIRPECPYGASRIDFHLESKEEKVLMEVKGCTLVKVGMGLFPDAPTQRGVKHLKELTAAVDQGYACYLAFVIQINNVDYVMPNRPMNPDFADAMVAAIRKGVKLIFLRCEVTPDSITVKNHHIIDHL